MTPAPSRKRLGYPVHTADLAVFCHPGGTPVGDALAAPFSWGGSVYASNGHMAIRLDKFFGDLPPENPELHARIAPRLPLGNCHFAPDPRILTKKEDYEKHWRPLDFAGAHIWHGGPVPTFYVDAAGRPFLNKDTIVRVGSGRLGYLALIQLLARLPRAEVAIDGTLHNGICCRFNGGVAALACIIPYETAPIPKVAMNILGPRRDTFTGSPIF